MIDTIFEYKKSNCGYGNLSQQGVQGFELKIKKDGLIEYIEIGSWDKILSIKEYQLSKLAVSKIEKIIESNNDIFSVNDKLYNGSCDGNGNTFFFSNEKNTKTVHALNIQNSIDDGREIRQEYLEKYGENLRQERIVLKVFFEICNVLKEEKLKLTLYGFSKELS